MAQTIFVYCTATLIMYLFASIASMRTNLHSEKTAPFWTGEVLLMLFTFATIFGMRYDVGTDHLDYLYCYQTGVGVERYEPFFQYITKGFKSAGIHYTFYFGFLAFIQLFFILYSIRDERYLYPSLILTLFLGGFFWHWMNGIRHDIASCIYVFAVNFIVDRKPLKFLLFILLSVCFHKTAILLLPTYLLLSNGNDLSMNRFFQLVLLAIVSYLTITEYDVPAAIFPAIELFIALFSYEETYDIQTMVYLGDETSFGITLYTSILLDALIILKSDKMKSFYNNRRFTVYYNLYYWGAVVLQIFLTNNLLFARVARPFRCFKILIIAYFLYYLYKNLRIKSNVVFLAIAVGLLLISFVSIIVHYPFYFYFDAQ